MGLDILMSHNLFLNFGMKNIKSRLFQCLRKVIFPMHSRPLKVQRPINFTLGVWVKTMFLAQEMTITSSLLTK